MSQYKKTNRRHRHLFFSQFQRWFIGTFVIFAGAFLALMTTGLYLWYRTTAQEFLNLSGFLSATFHEKISTSLTQGLWIVGVMNVVLLGLAVYQAIWFSKKIAGPVYALYQHLEKVENKGEWSSLMLRKGDLFSDLPEKLDRAHQKAAAHTVQNCSASTGHSEKRAG